MPPAEGGQVLSYDIYASSSYTTVWGGSTTQPVNGTGTAVNLTAYGRVPGGQTLVLGS